MHSFAREVQQAGPVLILSMTCCIVAGQAVVDSLLAYDAPCQRNPASIQGLHLAQGHIALLTRSFGNAAEHVHTLHNQALH